MMNRFRKILSAALAGCMAVSALMMSAGAANTGTEAAREQGHLRQSGVDGERCGSHSAQRRHSRAGTGVLGAVSRVDSAKQAASVSSTALAEVADVGSHSISGYYRNVYLTQDVKYKPLYSFLGNGETVSAFAVTIPGSKYNLGIYNETAQQDAGWLPNLSKGDRVLLPDRKWCILLDSRKRTVKYADWVFAYEGSGGRGELKMWERAETFRFQLFW